MGRENLFPHPPEKEVHTGGRHHAAPIICHPEQKVLAIQEGDKESEKHPSSSPVSAPDFFILNLHASNRFCRLRLRALRAHSVPVGSRRRFTPSASASVAPASAFAVQPAALPVFSVP